MNILTPEKIAELTDGKEGLANIRAINKLFRAQDSSNLYPIHNKFNATERAIRKIRILQREVGALYGYEYACSLDGMLSDIVNDEV